MRNPRLHPLYIDQVQHLIGLTALEEHHIHPPPRTHRLRAGVGMPGDPTGGFLRAHHPVSDPIQTVGGLMQLIRRRQRHRLRRRAVIGERDIAVISMSTRQLVQDLPQQPHRPRYLAQHPVRVSRIIKRASRVRQPTQPLIGLSSISNRINKRRHPNSPLYAAADCLRGRCARLHAGNVRGGRQTEGSSERRRRDRSRQSPTRAHQGLEDQQ